MVLAPPCRPKPALSYGCGVRLGERIAEGREAEIFAWKKGAVVKLYRGSAMGLDFEAGALRAIAAAGGPAPRLLGRVEVDGRPGLIIERLEGPDMLALIARAPWRVASLATSLAESHAAVNSIAAPPELPDLKATLEERIRAVSLRPELESFALSNLEKIPDGDRLLHGDFHPGNVIVTAGAVSVIDWPNATRGHPGADHARTVFLLTAGEPLNLPLHVRAIVLFGRRLFASIYRGKYRRLQPVDRAVVRHAAVAHIAARFWEGIAVEVPRLTALLEKALARA